MVGGVSDGTREHGFITDGATFTTIDVPGATVTDARGITTAGQIVGYFTDARGDHGFLATIDTTPPVITVSASPATLWPPNGRMVTVTVPGTITDEPDGSGVHASSAAYQVMDEYRQIQPSDSLTLGADGRYPFTVALQASRNGNDEDGRQYMIAMSAKDNADNPGVASTTATVPRN